MFRAAFLVSRARHFRPTCLCPPPPACASARVHYAAERLWAASVGVGVWGTLHALEFHEGSSNLFVGIQAGELFGGGWGGHFLQRNSFNLHPRGARRRNEPGLLADCAGGPTRQARGGRLRHGRLRGSRMCRGRCGGPDGLAGVRPAPSRRRPAPGRHPAGPRPVQAGALHRGCLAGAKPVKAGAGPASGRIQARAWPLYIL